MKKVLFGLVALSSLAFAQTNFYLKAGIDAFQKYDTLSYEGINNGLIEVTSDEGDTLGYEIGFEITQNLKSIPNLELGVGIAYQDHGDVKTKNFMDGTDPGRATMGSYDSLPFYLTGKYFFSLDSDIKPYVKADLGYSFNFNNDDYEEDYNYDGKTEHMSISYNIENGMYYGVGIGAEYNNITTELMYKRNEAEVKWGGNEVCDLDYSRVTLSFGYKFNF
jgi:outer membrane protein W